MADRPDREQVGVLVGAERLLLHQLLREAKRHDVEEGREVELRQRRVDLLGFADLFVARVGVLVGPQRGERVRTHVGVALGLAGKGVAADAVGRVAARVGPLLGQACEDLLALPGLDPARQLGLVVAAAGEGTVAAPVEPSRRRRVPGHPS